MYINFIQNNRGKRRITWTLYNERYDLQGVAKSKASDDSMPSASYLWGKIQSPRPINHVLSLRSNENSLRTTSISCWWRVGCGRGTTWEELGALMSLSCSKDVPWWSWLWWEDEPSPWCGCEGEGDPSVSQCSMSKLDLLGDAWRLSMSLR